MSLVPAGTEPAAALPAILDGGGLFSQKGHEILTEGIGRKDITLHVLCVKCIIRHANILHLGNLRKND